MRHYRLDQPIKFAETHKRILKFWEIDNLFNSSEHICVISLPCLSKWKWSLQVFFSF